MKTRQVRHFLWDFLKLSKKFIKQKSGKTSSSWTQRTSLSKNVISKLSIDFVIYLHQRLSEFSLKTLRLMKSLDCTSKVQFPGFQSEVQLISTNDQRVLLATAFMSKLKINYSVFFRRSMNRLKEMAFPKKYTYSDNWIVPYLLLTSLSEIPFTVTCPLATLIFPKKTNRACHKKWSQW